MVCLSISKNKSLFFIYSFMKYLKTFEKYEYTGYEGMLFINIPSTNYFKSDIKFQIIFVDTIIPDTVKIKGQDTIQFNQSNGEECYVYMTTWDQYYNEDDFKRIKFMTTEQFYKEYKPSYIRILDDLLDEIDKIDNKQKGSRRSEKLNKLVERLTIPEVDHIINSRKFNI